MDKKKLLAAYLLYKAGQKSKADDSDHTESSQKRSSSQGGNSDGMGMGCTIVMIIIGGIAGILVYRLFHGI